jgi:hypothetical protein
LQCAAGGQDIVYQQQVFASQLTDMLGMNRECMRQIDLPLFTAQPRLCSRVSNTQ